MKKLRVKENTLIRPEDAFALLQKLGAPAHLLQHVSLVAEAAELLLDKCSQLGVAIDCDRVRVGVVLHDVGKIIHQEEMQGPGSRHEPAGERMLLEQGVAPDIARICLSHARWQQMDVSLEELLVALADKLWKGSRVGELELRVIDALARQLGQRRWDVFTDLDLVFEDIASAGDERLSRSVDGPER